MTTPDRDLEEFLRRGLHAAAESIEPAPGGLERIRRRVASHRLQRQARLLLADCADLVRLLMIQLEPVMSWLARSIRSRTAGLHREDARPGHRVRRPAARPPADWLRPAMVVATAVVIVVAGVFGLAKLRQQPVTNLGNLSQSATSSSSSTHTARGSVAGTGRSAVPPSSSNPGVAPAASSSPSPSTSSSATPKSTCQSGSSGSKPASPTPSPTPTASDSASTSPSGTPTDTASATPTGSGSASGQSGGSAGGSSGSASPASSC